MGYVIAATFGMSIGVLGTYSQFLRIRYLPYLAVGIVLVIGVWVAGFSAIGSPGYGVAIALGGVVGATLAGGVVWRGHPMLEGSGYWSRAGVAAVHSGTLRRSLAEPTKSDSTEENR